MKIFFSIAAVWLLGLGPEMEADETLWRGLQIAPENRCQEYVSSHYPYHHSAKETIMIKYNGSYSPYTGKWYVSLSQLDIEHIVAKSEAHDSGLCSASATTKKAFAADLYNLTLTEPHVNRKQKVGKDAGEWFPPFNHCWFAQRVVEIKKKYRLTVDQKEADRLETVLSSCVSFSMEFPAKKLLIPESVTNAKVVRRPQK